MTLNFIARQLSSPEFALVNSWMIHGEKDEEVQPLIDKLRGNSLRYHFPSNNPKKELLTLIFDRALQKHRAEVIHKIQTYNPSEPAFYPAWKKKLNIEMPSKASAFFGSIFLAKIPVTVATFCCAAIATYKIHQKVTHLVAARLIPAFINNTPLHVIQWGNRALDYAQARYRRIATIVAYAFVIQRIFRMLPEIPLVSRLVRVVDIGPLYNIIWNSPQTIFNFAGQTAWQTARLGWNACNSISAYFHDYAERSTATYEATCRQKALGVFLKIHDTETP